MKNTIEQQAYEALLAASNDVDAQWAAVEPLLAEAMADARREARDELNGMVRIAALEEAAKMLEAKAASLGYETVRGAFEECVNLIRELAHGDARGAATLIGRPRE